MFLEQNGWVAAGVPIKLIAERIAAQDASGPYWRLHLKDGKMPWSSTISSRR